jgi:hypothetical protein
MKMTVECDVFKRLWPLTFNSCLFELIRASVTDFPILSIDSADVKIPSQDEAAALQ